jgi:hypothetical protein
LAKIIDDQTAKARDRLNAMRMLKKYLLELERLLQSPGLRRTLRRKSWMRCVNIGGRNSILHTGLPLKPGEQLGRRAPARLLLEIQCRFYSKRALSLIEPANIVAIVVWRERGRWYCPTATRGSAALVLIEKESDPRRATPAKLN